MNPKNITSFSIAAFSMVLSPGFANSQQVINGNLTVLGSECIGHDCSTSESFGFDTLRLKENNLRINFDDTSVAASFPRNDWRIIINDSANGGDSHFSIEDATAGRIPFRVEAGARSNSLFVESTGDVGFGTNNPVTDIHTATGDTPTVRLDQNGSSGWSPQAWDMAGNETNFFIRDVTNGSRLPFRIRPAAPTSSLDIANDGDVGFGTSNPQTKVHVVGGDGSLRIADTDTSGTNKFGYIVGPHFTSSEPEMLGLEVSARELSHVVSLGGGNSAYNAATIVRFFTGENTSTPGGTERMRLNASGQLAIARTNVVGSNIIQVGDDTTNGNGATLSNAGVWTNASSRANKINVKELSEAAAVNAVMRMKPITYNGKQDSAETYVGFIAEDVPELVATNQRKGIAAIEVSAVLTKVIKAHQRTIESQADQISDLTARLAKLEEIIERSSED